MPDPEDTAPDPAQPMRRDDGYVAMVSRDGEAVWVPPDQVETALASRQYELEGRQQAEARERKEELNTTGQMALTAAEGLGRGVTFGLSDVAGAAIDPEYAAAAEERREENARIAMGSELVGAAAPALLTGGTGALARGAAMTPAGLAARGGMAAERLAARGLGAMGVTGRSAAGRALMRGGEMAASGGVEGLAYGVGSTMSDAALQNTELTAEKVLVGGLEGLGLGAGGGAVLGGGLSFLGSAAGKAQGALSRTTREAGEAVTEGAGKARGFIQRQADELANRQALKAMGLQSSDTGKLVAKYGDEGTARLARRLHDEGLIEVGEDLTQRADRLKKLADDAGERVGNVVKRVDAEGGQIPTGLNIMKRVREDVINAQFGADALTRASNKQLIRKIEKDVLGPLAEMDMAGQGKLESLWEFRRKIDEMGNFGKEFSALSGGERAMRATRKVIEDEIEKTIAAHSPDLAATYKTAKDDLYMLGDIAKMSTKRAAKEEGNRFFSLSDNLFMAGGVAGALASGDIENAAYAGGLGLLNRFARTRGTVAASKIARRIADVNGRKQAVVRSLVDDAAPKVKPKTTVETLAKDLKSDMGDRAASAVRVGAMTVMDSEAQPKKQPKAPPMEPWETVVAQTQDATSNPVRFSERLGEQLGDLMQDEPRLAEAIIRNALADAQYLSQFLPQGYDRSSHSLTPFAEKPQIPRNVIASFMRRAAALRDPVSVAEALTSGDLSLEGVETLKARRPEMFQEMREDIIEATTMRTEPLPFSKRQILGIAFDFQADRSLDPQYTMRLQMDYAEAAKRAEEEAPPPPQQSTSPGSTAALTPAQKLARGA